MVNKKVKGSTGKAVTQKSIKYSLIRKVFWRLDYSVRLTISFIKHILISVLSTLPIVGISLLVIAAITLVFSRIYMSHLSEFYAADGISSIGRAEVLYFSIINYFTIGFGDIYPVKGALQNIVMIHGIIAFFTNIIIGAVVINKLIKMPRKFELSKLIIINRIDNENYTILSRYRIHKRMTYLFNMKIKMIATVLDNGMEGTTRTVGKCESFRELSTGTEELILEVSKLGNPDMFNVIDCYYKNKGEYLVGLTLHVFADDKNGAKHHQRKRFNIGDYSDNLIVRDEKYIRCSQYFMMEGAYEYSHTVYSNFNKVTSNKVGQEATK